MNAIDIIQDYLTEHLGAPLKLTGSYYFGHPNMTSDVDFFTDDTPDVEKALIKMGFALNPSKVYIDDDMTTKVYTAHHPTGLSIDVQLVKSAQTKAIVQSWLKNNKDFNELYNCLRMNCGKTELKHLWRGVCQLVDAAGH